MNQKIFAKEEFIGLPVIIIDSNDPNLKGKSGTIINETKNMFEIKINNKNKKIGKKKNKFEFKYKKKKIILNGSQITYKPKDRIKKTR